MKASAAPKFGLRLAAVRVQDFRSLHDVSVTFTKATTVLVGENNSGKTSLLEALAVALGRRKARAEDFYDGPLGRAKVFEIDLRIEPSNDSEFSDAVRDIIGNGIQLEGPEFFNIRVSGELSPDGWEVSVQRAFVKGWAASRSNAGALQLLDSPAVGRKALELLHYDMLDARRDIVEQLRNRNTHWGRTMANVSIADNVRENLEASLGHLGDEVTANSTVLSEVKSDLADLSEALAAGTLGVELEALPRNVDDLIRVMDIVITSPSSSSFSVSNHGMGTRSLAALLVFRSFVNVVRPRLQADRLLSVAAFEEPEAHLHPQSQRTVFQLLSGIGGQRIISTHSSHVAAIAPIDAYRLFRRKGSETVVSAIEPSKAATWSEEHVRRFVQIQNPDVLFAKVVGLVEGQTEGAAFPVFARAWWSPRGADGVGVSLIYTEGAGNSKHVTPFLDSLGIPWVVFCDGDRAADAGLAASARALGRSMDRNSPEVVQLPAGQAFEDYLVSEGFGQQIEAAVAQHEAGPLAEYVQELQGQKRKGGEIRDYTGPNGNSLALVDFMKRHKGTIGTGVAREIARGGPSGLPSLVQQYFSRLDKLRGPASA